MLPYPQQAAALAASYADQPAVRAKPREQAEAFLRSVWGAMPTSSAGNAVLGLVSDDSYIDRAGEKHGTTETRWEFADTRDQYWGSWLDWATVQNNQPQKVSKGHGSIYWNGAARRSSVLHRAGERGEKARGRLDELMFVSALWADFDCAAQNQPLAPVVDALLSMDMPPTWIIFSGGGIQCAHVLSEPITLYTPEAAQAYKLYSRAFYASLHGLLGLKMDLKVHEATRMMRLPGFINRKPERGGALARVLWHQPNTYSPESIKAAAEPYLPPPAPAMVSRPKREGLPLDSYSVGDRFLAHLVHGQPIEKGSRHDMVMALSFEAARAGMPQEMFEGLLLPAAKKWYAGEAYLSELQEEVNWVYSRADQLAPRESLPLVMGDTDDLPLIDGSAPAEYLIRVTAEQPVISQSEASPTLQHVEPVKLVVELIVDEKEIERQVEERVVEIEPIPLPEDDLTLEDLRVKQDEAVRAYLTTPTGKGTLLRLATPPGVGKTRKAIEQAIDHALHALFDADARTVPGGEIANVENGVIVATLFKMAGPEGKAWAKALGFEADLHPRLFFFFAGRTDDKNSPGYCAQHELADAVAAKGRNVIASVCNFCPVAAACKEKHYLSQFEQAKRHGIVVVRPSHLYMSDLTKDRKLIIIDESPFKTMAAPTVIPLKEMRLEASSSAMDSWPEEVATLDLLLSYLRDIVQANTAEGDEAVRLGGAWLFEKLEGAAPGLVGRVCEMSAEAVADISTVAIINAKPQAVKELPPNFVPELVALIKAEYPLYQAGSKRWNSRIVPSGHTLQLYPMEPFGFTQNTRVIVTDATEPDSYYTKAFTDLSGRPRQVFTFDRQVIPGGHTTCYLGTENTKSTLMRRTDTIMKRVDVVDWFKKRRKRDYTFQDTLELAEQLRKMKFPSLAQSITLIHQLAEKHQGSLLVVLYKKLIEDGSDESFLRYWLKRSGVLDPAYVQWFGNLRGRNDYKDLSAVLAIGTPRLRESDLLTQAQIWNHNDPIPVSADRIIRLEPYLRYVDEKGKGRAYRYWGYKDERVNSLYLNAIKGELKQCVERIRKNSSAGLKYVYLATAFPCSDKVNEFQMFHTAHLDEVTSTVLQSLFDETETEPQPIKSYVEKIASLAGVSFDTANRAYKRVRIGGIDPRDGKPWVLKLEAYEGRMALKTRVMEWLAADPKRYALSLRQMVIQLNADGIKIGLTALSQYLKEPDNSAIN